MRRSHGDPFHELGQLQEQINRAFTDLLGWAPVRAEAGRSAVCAPPMDVSETADAYVLRVDLPGVQRDETTVTAENSVLTIRGKRPRPEPPEGTTVHRVECPGGEFYRSFPLPAAADPSQISAKLDRGVLKVTIPKLAEAKPMKIEVAGE
jgi:HSP20 family protein